jgi:putative transposase
LVAPRYKMLPRNHVFLRRTFCMARTPVRERRHRLFREAYLGRRSVAFTACVEGRRRIFNDPDIMSAFVPLLGNAADRFDCAVPIYTFMPEHMHVLMIGQSETSDLKGAMDRFKSLSGWWFYRHRPDTRWQTGYWDHIVRDFEGWRSQARYIAGNPCRAGLCNDVFEWPHTGCIGFDLKEVILDAFW